MTADIPPKQYLIEKILPKGGVNFLFGPPGSFKTNFLIYLSLCAVNGEDVFGFKVPKPINIVWFDEENGLEGLHDKFKKISKGMEFKHTADTFFHIHIFNQLNVINDANSLYQYVDNYRPDLIIIDSLSKVFLLNERDETNVKAIFYRLSPILKNFDTAFLIIHHSRKRYQNQTYRGLEDLSGSRELGAMADSILYLDSYRSSSYILKQVKNRYDKLIDSINFEVESIDNSIKLVYQGTAREHIKSKVALAMLDIQNYIFENPGDHYTTKEILQVMKSSPYNHSEYSIYKALDELTNSGFLKKVKRGEYKVSDKEGRLWDI